ncbi:MAG: Holliday junction resolvase RuvX [Acidimicrobiia bacterium]
MSRVLGVDLGGRRIGIAASDPSGVLASPVGVVERRGDQAAEHREILDMAAGIGATTVVVGLPLSLDGSHGPAAAAVLEEVAVLAELARPAGVEIDTYDERFSTVTAEHGLREAKIGRKKRRDRIDAAAATVILQAWLEAHR